MAAGVSLSTFMTGAAVTIITDDTLRAPMNSPVAEPAPVATVVVNRVSRGDRDLDIFGERWAPEPTPKPAWIPPLAFQASPPPQTAAPPPKTEEMPGAIKPAPASHDVCYPGRRETYMKNHHEYWRCRY
jgi:hypothetical protein